MMWDFKDQLLDTQKRANPSEFLVLVKENVPQHIKFKVIEIAGRSGYISNLLEFIGDRAIDLPLQFEIIKITGKRERNSDLIHLLEKREMSPLVKKSIEVTLFSNVRLVSEGGHISDMILFMENPAVPEMVKINAQSMSGKTIDTAISKGYYQGFSELLGKQWVSEELQIRAFDHWEAGRATDLDLEILLRRNKLYKSLQIKIVDALFKRGATSRIPHKYKFKKLQQEREEEKGQLLSMSDFHKPKRKDAKGPRPIHNIQLRIRRRKVC